MDVVTTEQDEAPFHVVTVGVEVESQLAITLLMLCNNNNDDE